MFNLGTAEILVLLVIGLVLFGNRLPGLARSLGKGLVEFKQAVNGAGDEGPAR
jgi:sec-independent protein translocase protein TatA